MAIQKPCRANKKQWISLAWPSKSQVTSYRSKMVFLRLKSEIKNRHLNFFICLKVFIDTLEKSKKSEKKLGADRVKFNGAIFKIWP